MSETLYLAHHGIKGQKWGVRRFQEEDGSLTPAGRLRYNSLESYASHKPAVMRPNEGYVSHKPRRAARSLATRNAEAKEAFREGSREVRADRAKRIDSRKQAYQMRGMSEEKAYKKAVNKERRDDVSSDALMGAAMGVGYNVVASCIEGEPISLVGIAIDAGIGAVSSMLGGAIGRAIVKKAAGE